MGKEITDECSNLRKIILLRKILSSQLLFIASLYQKNDNLELKLESASFMELLKSLLALGFERNQIDLDYVF